MPEPLEDVQDRILDALHAGERLDREALLAAHPDHAEALARFLDLVQEIESPPPAAEGAPASLGEFRILREIGRGGMGVVYEAEQSSLRRRVALKVLPPAFCQDPRVVARFRREAEAAGRLRHPGIVPVYTVGEAGGTPFFAMELVAGRSLADVVRERAAGRDGGFPAEPEGFRRAAAGTVARVADALHAAHCARILHRDVKPGNILIEDDGTPRLTDFGLAADLAAPGLTVSGEAFGTPLYMSPEQVRRREAPLDPRTDVYSLGVTLYELLTLRVPYDGTTTPQILAAVQEGRIVAPRAADPSIPEGLERIVLRALRRAPEERYASAAAFADDLRNWLTDRPLEAPAADAPAPRRGRRRVVVAAAAVLLLGVVGLAVLFAPRGWPRIGADASDRASLTAAELRALAAGTDPDGERKLAAWVRPFARLRSVVARSHLGSYRFGLETGGAEFGDADGDVRAFVAARFDASVDGGPWKHVGTAYVKLAAFGSANNSPQASLADVLGGSVAQGSIRITHRARIRLCRSPESEAAGEIYSGPEDLATAARAVEEPGGTTWEWTETKTFFVYDEYPADYPKQVADASVDGPMATSVSAGCFVGPRIDADGPGGSSRALTVSLARIPPPGPVPLVCDVDLLDPATGLPLATSWWIRDARTPEDSESTSRSILFIFRLAAEPRPGEERFVLDFAGGRIDALRLALRPARDRALRETSFEQLWGRTVELTVPSKAAAEAGARTEARVVAASSGAPPAATVPPSLRALADGTAVDGERALAGLVRFDLRMRGVVSRRVPGTGSLSWTVGTAPGGRDAEALILLTWDASADGRTWVPLSRNVSGGHGEVPLSTGGDFQVRDVLGAAIENSSAEITHRVVVRAVRRPPSTADDGANLDWDDAQALPGGTTFTWVQRRSVLVYDDYPEDYPEAVGDATADTAMRESLRVLGPVRLAVGLGRRLRMNLPLGAPGPLPCASEVLLSPAGSDAVLGTGWLAQDAATPAASVGGRGLWIDVVLPETPTPEEAAFVSGLASGTVSEIRLRFRPSREVARVHSSFDRYWSGELDATVPVDVSASKR